MKYVVKLNEGEVFVPPLHTKTLDRRLIDGKLGARNFQLIYGEIEPGGVAQTHSHEMEQGGFILEGKALIEIEGERFEAERDFAFFIPSNAKHQITNIGATTLKLILVFAPPPRSSEDWQAR